jgi:RNA polymerase sigma factor (sigma-70 family)
MELTQNKLDLISRVVKTNRKYPGNEDLYEDFFNETCKRSLTILSSVDSEAALETYLRKIATTSILTVLKDSGRVRRAKGAYVASSEVSLDALPAFESVTVVDSEPLLELDTESYPTMPYRRVEIKNVPEDLVIRQEILEKIYSTVHLIAADSPGKQFLEIFDMRYSKQMTQKEIAGELKISQSEVSKKLMRLMEGVKQAFDSQD